MDQEAAPQGQEVEKAAWQRGGACCSMLVAGAVNDLRGLRTNVHPGGGLWQDEGAALRGGGEGSMAEGCACGLLRLWVAYMDCRQEMSNLMEVCQHLAICLLARPADAPSNFYHPVARFLFDGSWLSCLLEHGTLC